MRNMAGTSWSKEEMDILNKEYFKNMGLKQKDIADAIYPKLRERGYFRTRSAIIQMISVNKKEWFEENLSKGKNKSNNLNSVEIDVDTFDKLNSELNDLRIYKFKYYLFLLKKIFKENSQENIEWEKIETITKKMNALSESLK